MNLTSAIKMKTNKSYTKRLKKTRTGKIIARKAGQNHFNAKERGGASSGKRGTQQLTFNKKTLSRVMPYGTK
ncbi:MAG: 50S ribosomal protein L35 [Candidatus Paceibacterota bacterium]